MRDPNGQLWPHVRLIAAAVLIGLVALSTPVLVPVFDWAVELLLP